MRFKYFIELNPIHIVRYEDLVLTPKEAYSGLFKFMLGMENIDGTNVERRIDEVVAMGSKASQTYVLKATTGQFNMNAQRYTKEQMDFIKQEMGDLLYFLGYSNFDEKSMTNFFTFESHTEDHKGLHNGFRRANAESLAEVCAEPRQIKQYAHNYNKDMIELLNPAFAHRMQEPGHDFAGKQLSRATKEAASLGVKKQEI